MNNCKICLLPLVKSDKAEECQTDSHFYGLASDGDVYCEYITILLNNKFYDIDLFHNRATICIREKDSNDFKGYERDDSNSIDIDRVITLDSYAEEYVLKKIQMLALLK